MSVKGSASDSAKIEVVRNPKVYAEPTSIGVIGEFHFKVERAGGLVEEWSQKNAVSEYGQQQMIMGIATTLTDHFTGTTPRVGIFLSKTATSWTAGHDLVTLADANGSTTGSTAYVGDTATSPANLTAGVATQIVDDGTDFLYMLKSTDTCVFDGQSFSASGNGQKLSTFGAIVSASGGASGTIVSAGLCDGTTSTIASSKVFCATSINVALNDGDSLTTTYSLTLT